MRSQIVDTVFHGYRWAVGKTRGMSIETVGERLRALRSKKGWSQDKLGQHCGLSQGRISKLESGASYPTPDEWRNLLDSLGALPIPLPPRLALPYPDPRWRVPRPDYHCTGEVPLGSRIYRARKSFGTLADRRLLALKQRADVTLAWRFLDEACLDSGHEAMFWLHALHADARPCWFAPSKAGFRKHRIVERGPEKRTITDLRLACLQIAAGDLGILLYPQVTVDTRRAYYRLDVLACVIVGVRRLWVNVEIDGGGHDAEFDAERQNALALPTVRLGRNDLASEAMFETLCRRLRETLDAREPN